MQLQAILGIFDNRQSDALSKYIISVPVPVPTSNMDQGMLPLLF
jgi:hypothetical protein